MKITRSKVQPPGVLDFEKELEAIGHSIMLYWRNLQGSVKVTGEKYYSFEMPTSL